MKALILVMLALAACGVDGPPEAPQSPRPGITISGDASLGVRADDL